MIDYVTIMVRKLYNHDNMAIVVIVYNVLKPCINFKPTKHKTY